MKHLKLISALLLVSLLGSFVPDAHAQAATRVTPCSATTQNNELCITGTAVTTDTNGNAITGVTYRVTQKFGTGTAANVATGLTALQYYAKNLAPGSYTFQVFANCTACTAESAGSNAAAGSATPIPVVPSTPVIIIAATIRADGPPTFRVVYTVTPRPGEVVFVAPASLRPYVASR